MHVARRRTHLTEPSAPRRRHLRRPSVLVCHRPPGGHVIKEAVASLRRPPTDSRRTSPDAVFTAASPATFRPTRRRSPCAPATRRRVRRLRRLTRSHGQLARPAGRAEHQRLDVTSTRRRAPGRRAYLETGVLPNQPFDVGASARSCRRAAPRRSTTGVFDLSRAVRVSRFHVDRGGRPGRVVRAVGR